MWTNLVHINIKTQKPENHSQHLLDMFKPFEGCYRNGYKF